MGAHLVTPGAPRQRKKIFFPALAGGRWPVAGGRWPVAGGAPRGRWPNPVAGAVAVAVAVAVAGAVAVAVAGRLAFREVGVSPTL
ncbi:hypothetical protein ACLQ3A_31140 [Micromonospora zamorensis]|uniref:hypothetical protein n=1 Tax=Micromonospora zamorensis TaxID=709883 RepID=UPI003CFA5F6F